MTAPEDPARWTVDDDGDPVFGDTDITFSLLSSIPRGARIRRNAHAALVADVRAARVHEGCPEDLAKADACIDRLQAQIEGCTHTTDTLRRAWARWTAAVAADETEEVLERRASKVFAAVADLLAAEGPDHE